jgi:CRP-like cAMP-binding protein
MLPSNTTNLLLSALSPESRERLMDASTPVPLPLKTELYLPDEAPAYAFFITSGVASVVATVVDGGTAEVGLIGREGVVGALHLLGPAPAPTSCFIQLGRNGTQNPIGRPSQIFSEFAGDTAASTRICAGGGA